MFAWAEVGYSHKWSTWCGGCGGAKDISCTNTSNSDELVPWIDGENKTAIEWFGCHLFRHYVEHIHTHQRQVLIMCVSDKFSCKMVK